MESFHIICEMVALCEMILHKIRKDGICENLYGRLVHIPSVYTRTS